MKHRFLGSCLVIVLFVGVVGLILTLQIRHLIDAKLILKNLAAANVYNEIPGLINDFSKNMESSEFADVLEKTVDPEFVRTQTEANLPNIIAFITGKTDVVETSFDLRNFKSKLTSTSANEMAKSLKETLDSMPECPKDYKPIEGQVPTCRPAINSPLMKAVSSGNLTGQIPDQYNPTTFLKNNPEVQKIRRNFFLFNLWFYILIGLNILIAVILSLISGSFKNALGWVGTALIIPASAVLVLNLSAKFIFTGVISRYTRDLEGFSQTANQLAQLTLTEFYFIALLYGGIFFVLGLIFIIVSKLLPGPTVAKPAPPALQPAPAAPAPKK